MRHSISKVSTLNERAETVRNWLSINFVLVPYKEIGGKTMVLAVYDFDRFGKHDIIGKIEIPMNSIDLGQVYEATKELEAADKVIAERVLRVCLSEFPTP